MFRAQWQRDRQSSPERRYMVGHLTTFARKKGGEK